jgi:hypothetical protein
MAESGVKIPQMKRIAQRPRNRCVQEAMGLQKSTQLGRGIEK